MINIRTPLKEEDLKFLKAGDEVLLSGIIYTARDQAHHRLTDEIKNGRTLPFDLKGQIIYYCGPAGTPKGRVIGSCGPTTSSRMDIFTPLLLKEGLKGMIGKGRRSREVTTAIKRYKSVYFLAPAGCGALLSKYVNKASVIAYRDLGPEQILKLEVKNLPLIVGVDIQGGNVYD